MVTEKRLIDGNKAQKVLLNMAEHLLEAGNPEMAGAVGYAAEVIGNQKSVDAVEVVHGEWLINRDPIEAEFKCSECGYSYIEADSYARAEYNYCPNCGAKMDGDGND